MDKKVAEKGLVDNKAKRVSILVMNPNNGEILAMVSYPGYDNNKLANGVDSEYYANKTITNR